MVGEWVESPLFDISKFDCWEVLVTSSFITRDLYDKIMEELEDNKLVLKEKQRLAYISIDNITNIT